jgi:hypothetical protein
VTADDMPDPGLPQQPAPTASYGERDYYRRRIDELMDERVQNLVTAVGDLGHRVDIIDSKLGRVFGGLAVIVVLASIFGPPIVKALFGLQP